MSEQVYKKVGRKYIKLGYEDGFTGFPSEGIWVVFGKPGCKSSSCIAFAGEFKAIDYSLLASLTKEKEENCLKAFETARKSGASNQDTIRAIFETLLTND